MGVEYGGEAFHGLRQLSLCHFYEGKVVTDHVVAGSFGPQFQTSLEKFCGFAQRVGAECGEGATQIVGVL